MRNEHGSGNYYHNAPLDSLALKRSSMAAIAEKEQKVQTHNPMQGKARHARHTNRSAAGNQES